MKKEFKKVKYEDGSILYFYDYNQFLLYQGVDNVVFENYYCSAGYNSVRVEADGSVYRSQAACLKLPESRLGSIIEGFEFSKIIQKCEIPIACHCFNRLYTGKDYPKYIDENYLGNYCYPNFSSGMKRFLYKLKNVKIFRIFSRK